MKLFTCEIVTIYINQYGAIENEMYQIPTPAPPMPGLGG